MTATLISTDKPFKSTWLGRPGTAYCLHYDKQRMGKRISIVIWGDDQSVNIKAINGDGRKSDFVTYEEQDLPHFDDIDAYARQMAERHFS